MEEGLAGSDLYLEQWQWRDLDPREGVPSAVLDAVAAELVRAAPTPTD
jgi:hypothetical protein